MEPPDLTLVLIADTHIQPYPDDRLDGEDTFANLNLVLDRIASSGVRPHGFIFAGDLANDGELESYERLAVAVSKVRNSYGVPVAMALGNHDAREPFRTALVKCPASTERHNEVVTVGPLRIIILDTLVPGRPYGQLGHDQLDWLKLQLGKRAEAGTILVMHHPPIYSGVAALNHILLMDTADFHDTIHGTDVIGILAGHVHHPTAGMFGGVPVWSGPAIAYSLDPCWPGEAFRSITGSGFSIISIRGRTMVASAVMMPSMQREIVVTPLTPSLIERWLQPPPI